MPRFRGFILFSVFHGSLTMTAMREMICTRRRRLRLGMDWRRVSNTSDWRGRDGGREGESEEVKEGWREGGSERVKK